MYELNNILNSYSAWGVFDFNILVFLRVLMYRNLIFRERTTRSRETCVTPNHPMSLKEESGCTYECVC